MCFIKNRERKQYKMKSETCQNIDNTNNKSNLIKSFKKTNKKMMILSCIGIILVVLGHTGDSLKLASDIFPYYSFHMTLFVFISGYFYNPKNEVNLYGKNGYIVKKIKRMVIPYFIWNLIYGIIVTIFRKLDIISFGESINFTSLFVRPWTTGHQYILNLASWFLLALFLVNMSYIFIRKILNKIKIWNDYIATFVFFIISILSIYLSQKNMGQNYIPLLRTCFFMFFYQLGYLYKTKIEGKLKINKTIYFILLIVIQLIILKLEGKISYVLAFMRFNNKFIITPIIVSITGIMFWMKIAEILIPSLENSKIINYISNNTYDIMQHHLFWIFILNLLVYLISDMIGLQGFNIDRFRTTIYYCYTAGVVQSQIIYTIIGIAMPLIIRYLYEKIKNKAINVYTKKNTLINGGNE